MTQLTIRALAFPSFMKLCAVMSFGVGVGVGVVAFVATLFDADIRVALLVIELTGVAGGIAAIPAAPIIFTLFGVLAAIVGFLPFNWFLRTMGGIDVTGDWGSAAQAPADEVVR
jgi:hypothetical protein